MFMKHWLGALLAALLLFSLSACGGALQEVPDEGTRMEEELTELPVEDAEDVAPEDDPGETAVPEEASDGEDARSPDDADPEPSDPDTPDGGNTTEDNSGSEADVLPENGSYTSKEDVALYIHLYGRLPDNFITKKEAQNLGWSGGSLEPYAPGMCIGGNRFGNYEGLLPESEGRSYTECDIDTLGAGSRGAKRIVFSNDGLVYYTEDHYESFELLYGEEDDG